MHCCTRCEQTPHLAKRKGEIRVRLLRILVRTGLVQPNLDWIEWVVFEGVNVSVGGGDDEEEEEAKGDENGAHGKEMEAGERTS